MNKEKPKTFDELSIAWNNYWSLFYNSENFNLFLTYFSFYLYYIGIAKIAHL